MGIRFRKRIGLGKLIHLNLSKSGVSITAGVKGASVNVGNNGTYLNTGIPGTGLYSREKISGSPNKRNGEVHSQESINRAQKVLDEYDANQEQIELEHKKSNIAPNINTEEIDELFYDVANYVISEDCVSPGKIKSKFNINYVRTEKIIQQLENARIISCATSTGRKVIITIEAFNKINL